MKSSLLAEILEPGGLEVLFQPIFERSGHLAIHGLEAVVRGPRGTHFEHPDMLLEYVRRKRAEVLVDRSYLRAACDAARQLPQEVRIHLNLHASTLAQNPGFVQFLRVQAEHSGVKVERLTVEIMDHHMKCNQANLLRSIRSLRDLGVRIALDDLGAVNSSYRLLVDCSPDYLKLDSFFTQGVHTNPSRWAIVESMVTLSRAIHSRLVALGVGTREDLSALAQMGITLAQADFLCRAISVGSLLGSGLLQMGNPAGSNRVAAAAGESGKQTSRSAAAHNRGACYAD